MAEKFLSNEDFLKSLDAKDDIKRGDGFVVAVIKKSDQDHMIHVSTVGPCDWIEMPVAMVESAKIVGTAVAGVVNYPIALIKLAEPDEKFARVAYQLLAQMGTIGGGSAKGGHCDCHGSKNGGHEDDDHAGGDTAAGSVSTRSRIGAGIFTGGFGGLGIRLGCRFVFRCYDCTRCIPWTDYCWSSTCCDLMQVDCSVGS